MITLLVLTYTYMVWLFTAYNPMPHLGPYLIIAVIPETLLEIIFMIFITSVAKTIFKRPNHDRCKMMKKNNYKH